MRPGPVGCGTAEVVAASLTGGAAAFAARSGRGRIDAHGDGCGARGGGDTRAVLFLVQRSCRPLFRHAEARGAREYEPSHTGRTGIAGTRGEDDRGVFTAGEGRSERNFGTWQGRLPQELRVRGISDLARAN